MMRCVLTAFAAFALIGASVPAEATPLNSSAVDTPREQRGQAKATAVEQALLDATFACLLQTGGVSAKASVSEVLGAVRADGTALPPTGKAIDATECAAGASLQLSRIIAAHGDHPAEIEDLVADYGAAAQAGAAVLPESVPDEGAALVGPSLASAAPNAAGWIAGMNRKQDISGSFFIADYGDPGYYDWSSDECSAPLVGNGQYNFEWPCRRHDFSWRNLKRGEARYPRHDMWSVKNKAVSDRQFREDLYLHCDLNFDARYQACMVEARIYHYAVSYHGANTFGMERNTLFVF